MSEQLAQLEKKGGALTETELWSNPNTTVDFTEQNVTLSRPYTDFKRIRIYFRVNRVINDVYYVDYPFSTVSQATGILASKPMVTTGALGTAAQYLVRVYLFIASTTVTITHPYRQAATGYDDSGVIPVKICGLN